MSPNRIVGGKRDHRVLFLYNVFKQQLESNWITAPRICPEENVDISEIAKKYNNIYPDIEQVFNRAPLPKLFPGENTQEMASCWLTNFDQAADSLLYVPTETVYLQYDWTNNGQLKDVFTITNNILIQETLSYTNQQISEINKQVFDHITTDVINGLENYTTSSK